MSGGSRAWSWRHAFSTASLPATTKHVLHTLGMFMNELGEGCYPSVADICRYSGLDKKTVLKHLGVARDAGWIAVSQHGYRGQKWKRQEYAACWPERDLIAACAPAEQTEGGGAVPPPCMDKVVELVPEGGGIEGSKVVEQLHQDKTSPVTNPITSPIERGVREENSNSEKQEDRKSLERSFWKIVKDWPQIEGMPKDKWLAAWGRLTSEERVEAAEKRDAWLALLKANKRDNVPVPETYFREKLWKDVPESMLKSSQDDGLDGRVKAPAFGNMWAANVYRELWAGATAPQSLDNYDQKLVDEGRYTAEHILLGKQARYGFPNVNMLFDRATAWRGVLVSSDLKLVSSHMVAILVGGDLWSELQDEHAKRGWPWFPKPGKQTHVCLPKGVAGLNEIQKLWQGLDK